MNKFEEYQKVALSLDECDSCHYGKAYIIEDDHLFHVECADCGKRTDSHEVYQDAAKEWNFKNAAARELRLVGRSVLVI